MLTGYMVTMPGMCLLGKMLNENTIFLRDKTMSDLFEERLSSGLASQPELARQAQGRSLSGPETTFAEELMKIYATGEHDFDAVATALTNQGVIAPVSRKQNWDRSLLEAELKQINAELDKAYAENGFGA